MARMMEEKPKNVWTMQKKVHDDNVQYQVLDFQNDPHGDPQETPEKAWDSAVEALKDKTNFHVAGLKNMKPSELDLRTKKEG